ncbi:hypothetical protein CPHO_12300 [Corynebacterium phocae]|uniref:Uncharacterized protein n=1 Tax=Corynebacterium phocae TaxID=161895 RepID=A0A1L7D6C9_9CORY|nr:hypothetical protein [Corynebacterium phocae]APT93543.1 hypothetical protein CPHO_12300 [Corynebacterium phocae]KAA8720629.1 hypothetical protein F4V58_11740 [Corynebacterium phocae]
MIYIRTTLEVPGAGTVTHVAELEEIDTQSCHMHRLVVIQDRPLPAEIPNPVVPHPDTYGQYPGLSAQSLRAEEFHLLWEQAHS